MSNQEQNKNFADATEKSRILATTVNGIIVDQLELSDQIGALRNASFIRKVVTVTELKILYEIKKSNKYKGLKIINEDGEVVTVTSWNSLCQAIGFSREHVDENLRNLSALGEDFIEASRRMGLGYRDLRKLRRLPDEEQTIIIESEAVAKGDTDTLKEMLEDAIIKHAKEKDQLESQVKHFKKEAEAKDAVIRQKQATIDTKNDEIIAMDKKLAISLNSPVHERAIAPLETLESLIGEALKLNGEFNALYQQIEQDKEVHQLIRTNLGHAQKQIVSNANDLIDFYKLHDTLNKGLDTDYLDLVMGKNKSSEQSSEDESFDPDDLAQAFDLKDVDSDS